MGITYNRVNWENAPLKKIPLNAGDRDCKIYVVTYFDDDEPVVTLFDNQEAANKCYQYLKNYHAGCCIDECEVCSSFIVS